MVAYNVLVKVFRNEGSTTADSLMQSYLNSVDSAKVIRGIGVTKSEADNVIIVLVIDA